MTEVKEETMTMLTVKWGSEKSFRPFMALAEDMCYQSGGRETGSGSWWSFRPEGYFVLLGVLMTTHQDRFPEIIGYETMSSHQLKTIAVSIGKESSGQRLKGMKILEVGGDWAASLARWGAIVTCIGPEVIFFNNPPPGATFIREILTPGHNLTNDADFDVVMSREVLATGSDIGKTDTLRTTTIDEEVTMARSIFFEMATLVKAGGVMVHTGNIIPYGWKDRMIKYGIEIVPALSDPKAINGPMEFATFRKVR